MRRTSTPLPQSRVARYVDLQLQAIEPKKSAQVADEAGFPQRNLLSMIRTGATKLPFERIAGLAKALRVDQNHLFRLALVEYMPHVNTLLDDAGRQAISEYERELLTIWRNATGDQDPAVEPVREEFLEIGAMARQFSQHGQVQRPTESKNRFESSSD
jgi:hypothetical protein